MGSSFDSIRDDEEEEARKRYVKYSKEKAKNDALKLEEDKKLLSSNFHYLIHNEYEIARFLYDNKEQVMNNRALISLLGKHHLPR